LLYRGADPSLINGNNQTAVQVAQIVGNMAVANVILGHSPQSVGKRKYFFIFLELFKSQSKVFFINF